MSGIKYDNDGYPDLMPEPTVTIPRPQYEALMGAASVLLKCEGAYSLDHINAEQDCAGEKAIAALRAAGTMEEKT